MRSEHVQQLWDRLLAAGVVSAPLPPAAKPTTPWYVGAMLGVSGWIAAICLLGFFAFIFQGRMFDNRTAALSMGAVLIGAALVLFRYAGRITFASQFGLALSLAGQMLLGIGIYELQRQDVGAFWFTMAAFEGALAIALPNSVHRAWSAYASATALAIAMARLHAGFVTTGMLAAGVAALWLKELEWARFGSVLRPIGYGLALALLQVAATSAFVAPWILGWHSEARGHFLAPWMGELTAAAVLIVVVWKLIEREGIRLPQRAAVAGIAVAALVGAVSCKAPGIAAALTIVLLGYAGGNRVLCGLGFAALAGYLFAYYYNLNATLLVKSGLLAATGCVLLAARALLRHSWRPEAGIENA